MANTHTYTRKEEIANAITHGIGALFSIVGLVFLVVMSAVDGSVWHVVSFSIYGASMLLLYTASTLVHSFPEGKAKDLFEIFDHAAIYIFIAGTYTPFLFIAVKGALGWTLFGVVWGIAILGVFFKAFFVKRFLFISTIIYIVMGWLALIAWKPLMTTLPSTGMQLFIIGGVLYTVGTVFYVWRGFPYHHAVWHLFVLAGSAAHFFAILLYILPIQMV
ncbi:PAQR family membrane homeostasis protein TrhA [Pseudalkalibacillus salsuginis]|uniref:PAQR family membrane homeostasis protein TrhA n=1 Tax=Pseudalkalibacillus salsuginis TaxID=2910972 RepID=UPI001F465E55|nr:hemolysin III family protein [Pseudalkalibacillus salsuginis]MCF6409269.1 hemolysin III family protein [Pseudalkalibacillus salsuginis]